MIITAAIAGGIWRFFVGFSGTVIILFTVISFVLVLGEMLYYKMNTKLTNDLAARTGDTVIPPGQPDGIPQAVAAESIPQTETARGIPRTDAAAEGIRAASADSILRTATATMAATADTGTGLSSAGPSTDTGGDTPQNDVTMDDNSDGDTSQGSEKADSDNGSDPGPENMNGDGDNVNVPEQKNITGNSDNVNVPEQKNVNSESAAEDGAQASEDDPQVENVPVSLEPEYTPVKPHPRIALITGASSGLGREYAELIDTSEQNIDEIWLIARRKEALEQTASLLTHRSRVIPADLTERSSITKIGDMLKCADAQVGILISCAGFAKIGDYSQISLEDSDKMIDLNCRAAVDVTLCSLPHMSAGDRIIEVCSTAAFQPLQHINIYAAGKAFLYNYTRALRMELLPRGIIVTAVCPYWIRDTEFIPVAQNNPQTADTSSSIRSFPFSVTAKSVAVKSLRASRAGWAVSTPGVFCTIHRIFSKLIPRQALIYFWEGLRRL